MNGVKAAAVDSAGPLCSVGVFVAGGSSAETPATAGAAKLLEFAAFMATANRTTFRWAGFKGTNCSCRGRGWLGMKCFQDMSGHVDIANAAAPQEYEEGKIDT